MIRLTRHLAVGIVILALLSSCGGGGGGGSSSGGAGSSVVSVTIGGSGKTASIRIEKNTYLVQARELLKKLLPDSVIAGIPPAVYKINISISAADLNPPLTKELKQADFAGQDSVTASFSVPNGSNRSLLVEAKDSAGVVLYRGQAVLELNGANPSVTVSMTLDQIPTVLSTSPANGATNVMLGSAIAVTFSESMAPSTINSSTFTVSAGGVNIAGTVAYSGTTATFTPSSNLASNTTYKLTVKAGVKDLLGKSMDSDYVLTFTTSPTILMGGSIQGSLLALTGTVTTFAGTAGSSGSTDASGTAARFARPYGITTDGANLFVADANNYTIRKIVISTGAVTTLAGQGVWGYADGIGSAARFAEPAGITTDGTNLFVSDRSLNTIRKIVISTGAVTTLAGNFDTFGSTDGTGTAATFNQPNGITTDGSNLFIADQGNHTIRKIVISTGAVTTFAGTAGSSGSTDASGTAARFYQPRGITTDGTSLFVADSGNNTIRKIVISTGQVTTLAGTPLASGSTDGTGSAAKFKLPVGITTDGTNLFIVDNNNHTIRKLIPSTGVVTTLAGTALTLGSTDGTGAAASFRFPLGVTTDGASLFIADGDNYTIRKMQ